MDLYDPYQVPRIPYERSGDGYDLSCDAGWPGWKIIDTQRVHTIQCDLLNGMPRQ